LVDQFTGNDLIVKAAYLCKRILVKDGHIRSLYSGCDAAHILAGCEWMVSCLTKLCR
jgi:hypothetical protein